MFLRSDSEGWLRYYCYFSLLRSRVTSLNEVAHSAKKSTLDFATNQNENWKLRLFLWKVFVYALRKVEHFPRVIAKEIYVTGSHKPFNLFLQVPPYLSRGRKDSGSFSIQASAHSSLQLSSQGSRAASGLEIPGLCPHTLRCQSDPLDVEVKPPHDA